ncbi:hypothetical protein VPH35_074960 [Triticum aestivum]
MAVSFHPAFPLATAPPLPHHLDATADPEVADALLGFLCDPIDPAMDAGIDGFLDLSPVDPDDGADVDDLQPCAKRPRAGCGGDDDGHAWLDFEGVDGHPWRPEFATEFVLPLPPPPPQMPHAGFVRGADARRAEGNARVGQTAPSAAARERRRRISEKTAELSRLVPGGHRLNTAEMLQEAGRHVKLLQAQVGVLALMGTLEVTMSSNRHNVPLFFVRLTGLIPAGEDRTARGARANARAAHLRRRARAAGDGGQVLGAEETGGGHGRGQGRQVQQTADQRPHQVQRVAAGAGAARRGVSDNGSNARACASVTVPVSTMRARWVVVSF